MSRVTFILPFVAAALVMFSVQSASAGCAEDIEKAKQTRTDSNSGPRAQNAFDRVIERAEKAQQAGQEKKCENLVKAALSKL